MRLTLSALFQTPAGWAVVCKPGFEAELQTELALRLGSGSPPARPPPGRDGAGLVARQAVPGAGGEGLPAAPLIFERQRLPGARKIAGEGLEAEELEAKTIYSILMQQPTQQMMWMQPQEMVVVPLQSPRVLQKLSGQKNPKAVASKLLEMLV